MKWRIKRALYSLLGLVLLASVGGWLLVQDMQRALDTPLPISRPELYEILAGQTITKIARTFVAKDWLTHAIYLRLEATRLGVAARVQIGTYEILPGTTPRELLEKFVRGEVKQYQFTVVEGPTFRELCTQLARLPGVKSTIQNILDGEVMRQIGASDQQPEGRFFPSTYFYLHHTQDTELLTRAYREMQRVLDAAWQTRARDLPYSTSYDALIMASIIEKETARTDERRAIAGVFVRRLQQGMKLQTDPTVIYGLGSAFDGNLRRTDLRRDTPFNTYTRFGLPPTPIAMPGAHAIGAALNPAPGTALYFVARGDGSHEFSDTLAAHQKAVRQYQLK